MGKTATITVEVPAKLAEEWAGADQDLVRELVQRGLRDLHIEQALERYQQGGISFAAAAKLAEVSRAEFARAAYVRGIEPPFDPDMLEEELA